MKKNHLIQLSKFYKPYSGGLESVVADIAEGVNGFKVSVLAADPNNLTQSEIINNIEVIRSKEYFNFASTSFAPGYIIDLIKHSDNSILHVHLPNPLANIALFLAFLGGQDLSQVVIHWHSDIIKQKYLLTLYKPLQSWLLKKAKVIIVTSQRYLDSSEPLMPYRDKCIVVPIGIDSIQPKVNENLVLSLKSKYRGKKIVFSLGRHIYYKGFEYLIEAARKVENSVFLIGGKGPDTHKYISMIKEYNLEDRVKLIGRVEDEELPSYYAAADVFCFPSIEKSEAFGVVQLESMSVSTPVISTDIAGSGVPWVNKHGESGLVCEPKDVKSLAEALNRVLNNNELHKSLSKGAYLRYLKYFTKDKMINKTEQVYKDINQQ